MSRLRVVLVLAVLAGLGLVGWAGDEEPTAKINFMVVKDYNGKPIKDASVVLHPVNRKGKQGRGGYELKTDSDGKTQFEGVPYGSLRVQVLAPGFQTFGEDYVVGKAQMEITIKLKRPAQQYSIYGDSTQKKDEKPAGEGKPQ